MRDFQRLARKYADLVRQDIDLMKPTLVITCPDEFDYLRFLSINPAFAATWAHYRRQGKVFIDYNVYYPHLPPDASMPATVSAMFTTARHRIGKTGV